MNTFIVDDITNVITFIVDDTTVASPQEPYFAQERVTSPQELYFAQERARAVFCARARHGFFFDLDF